ncbi:MAG TPA: MHYT domain-containing protein [Rhizomicrobium sp.]|nr:MHYT domain-containing protein [Rhizomicrobium sp.]
MIHVLGCIFQQHDLRLVAVAAALCLLASATALTMIARARVADAGRGRLAWLAGAGAVAGCGIWGTHFVAMLAYSIGLPLGFATGLTVASALVAMSLCGAGFALAVMVDGALGGMVTGFAICAMHYIGMAAVELPARAQWDLPYVIASVMIGISVSGLALHFALRRKSRRDYALAAGLFTLAIVGLHFTAMAAVRYIPDGSHPTSLHVINPFALAVVVAACAAFIVSQGLVVAIVDRYLAARAQGEALRMRNHITELETAQQALEKTSTDLAAALEAAEAASKSKSAFLASMSHELRTPLNAVLGFSETIQMETFGPLGSPRYKEYLGNIYDSGAHLLSLINDILDISRFDAGNGELNEEIFDLSGKIANTMRMVEIQAAKAKVAVIADIAPDLPYLNADKRRVRQILLNLLSNALKFTQVDGSVTVRAFCVEEGFVMQVADTGIGIAAHDFAKALEPFGQVDSSLARKYEGTGLGLPLTRLMAELHGGQLTLDSVPGHGTTVTVTFPAWRLVSRASIAA